MTSLKKELEELQGRGKQKAALLELMQSLHESGEAVKDIIESSMEEINLLSLPLTKSDVHALLSVIKFSRNLTFLSLITCNLDAQDIRNLAYTLRDHNVTVVFIYV